MLIISPAISCGPKDCTIMILQMHVRTRWHQHHDNQDLVVVHNKPLWNNSNHAMAQESSFASNPEDSWIWLNILTVMSACVISGADNMNTAAQSWLQHFLFMLLWRCMTLILGALSCRARNSKMIPKAWQTPGKVTERESPDRGIAHAVSTGECCEIVCSATVTLWRYPNRREWKLPRVNIALSLSLWLKMVWESNHAVDGAIVLPSIAVSKRYHGSPTSCTPTPAWPGSELLDMVLTGAMEVACVPIWDGIGQTIDWKICGPALREIISALSMEFHFN